MRPEVVLGLVGWLKQKIGGKKPPAAEADPVKAYDRRLDSLSGKASDLRKSAATLLAARGEIDRALAAQQAIERQSRERIAQAAGRPDVVEVLEADAARARTRIEALGEERARLDEEARNLAETIAKLEAEADVLRRERDSAAARWTASRTMAEASSKVFSESFGEMAAIEKARDEVERAHALAEVVREDLKAREGKK